MTVDEYYKRLYDFFRSGDLNGALKHFELKNATGEFFCNLSRRHPWEFALHEVSNWNELPHRFELAAALLEKKPSLNTPCPSHGKEEPVWKGLSLNFHQKTNGEFPRSFSSDAAFISAIKSFSEKEERERSLKTYELNRPSIEAARHRWGAIVAVITLIVTTVVGILSLKGC